MLGKLDDHFTPVTRNMPEITIYVVGYQKSLYAKHLLENKHTLYPIKKLKNTSP
jgi:hypothetical protein